MMNGKILAANIVYRILNVAVVFLITVLLSRLTGAAGYGVLSLLIANTTIFNLVSGLGSDAGITFNTASGRLSSAHILTFIGSILLFQVILLLIVEASAWLFNGQFLLFKTDQLQYAWRGFVFLISISLVEKYTALFNGKHLFSLVNRVLLASNLLMLVLFAGIYYFTPGRPVLFFISLYVLLSFLQAIFLIITYHSTFKQPIAWEMPGKAAIAAFFSYSLFALVINIIQFLAYRMDYWILDHYRGNEELGWYALAVRLSQLFWILPLLFASMILPAVADTASTYDENRMQSLVRGMNLLNILSGLVLFVIAPVLIPFLFGREYVNSIILLQFLLPGVILFCIATLLAAYFAGQKKLQVNFWGSFLCFAVILTLDLLLIPSLGMKGAAIASSVGYGITGLYFIIMYCSFNNLPVAKLFVPGRGDRQYILGILAAIFSKK